jgi:hypothetical protein
MCRWMYYRWKMRQFWLGRNKEMPLAPLSCPSLIDAPLDSLVLMLNWGGVILCLTS